MAKFNYTKLTDIKLVASLCKFYSICEALTYTDYLTTSEKSFFAPCQYLTNETLEQYIERVARRLGIIQTNSADKSVQTESVDLLEIGTQTNVLNHNVATQVEPVVKEEMNLMEFEPEENLSHEREQLITEEALEIREPKGKGCKEKMKESCVIM